jgi:hypothetical protein
MFTMQLGYHMQLKLNVFLERLCITERYGNIITNGLFEGIPDCKFSSLLLSNMCRSVLLLQVATGVSTRCKLRDTVKELGWNEIQSIQKTS